MAVLELLVARIKVEYGEMPGLQLTLAQACRLWDVDTALCEAALDGLLRDGFLHRTREGRYVLLPAPAGDHAKITPDSPVLPRRRA